MTTMRGTRGSRGTALRFGGLAGALLLATTSLTPAWSEELHTSVFNDVSPADIIMMSVYLPPLLARDGSRAVIQSSGDGVAWWDGGTPVPFGLPGRESDTVTPVALSDDGDTLVGMVGSGPTQSRFRFDGTTLTLLETFATPSTNYLDAIAAASGDANVIVGRAYNSAEALAAQNVPVYWDSTGAIHALDAGIWTYGEANLVSGNGEVIYGRLGAPTTELARWQTDSGALQTLTKAAFLSDTGNTASDLWASATNYDGSRLTGYFVGEGSRPFLWSDTDGFRDLGMLDGFDSGFGALMSRSGDVVAGYMQTGDFGVITSTHAFRWTDADGLVDISIDRAERTGSYQDLMGGMSDDGTVIVGTSLQTADLYPEMTTAPRSAFRWSLEDGWQTMADYFTGKGIDVTGMSFLSAGGLFGTPSGISADGNVMVGNGSYDDGVNNPVFIFWLSRCGDGDECGVTTVDGVYRSVESVGASGETANLHVDDLFDTVSHALAGPVGKNGSAYAYGSFDTDPMAGGGVGLDFRLSDTVTAGFLVDQSVLDTDLAYDGWSSFDATSVVAKIAGRPAAGFVWEAGLAAAWLDGDVKRGYLNGVDPVTSRGDTSGYTLGASATLGWRFALPAPATSLTPYATYTVMQSDFDGWTETNGPFPAVISGFTTTTQLIRAGLELEHRFAAGPTARLGLAGVHRETDGDTIAFDLPGLFGGTVEGDVGAANWLETSVAFDVPFGASVSGLAKVTGRLPDEGDASVAGHIGLKIAY
ncbi:autotransporter domain-containing protein [Prosthecomicrobium pneumaticum]|uniref:Autotransporter domain-containing protein n=1 Tax=Prosthecomicrobium pneumaticum TaxID=81895 RepID=A0A7W9FLI0_9HYPH|nr:autotransporter outer membrane beta-barrel domain-containing protein [Prosthecomicrobium pneumaticum]MBB5752866.1 hypothetical protein [Prosthecomicrobium pneumaticum]